MHKVVETGASCQTRRLSEGLYLSIFKLCVKCTITQICNNCFAFHNCLLFRFSWEAYLMTSSIVAYISKTCPAIEACCHASIMVNVC